MTGARRYSIAPDSECLESVLRLDKSHPIAYSWASVCVCGLPFSSFILQTLHVATPSTPPSSILAAMEESDIGTSGERLRWESETGSCTPHSTEEWMRFYPVSSSDEESGSFRHSDCRSEDRPSWERARAAERSRAASVAAAAAPAAAAPAAAAPAPAAAAPAESKKPAAPPAAVAPAKGKKKKPSNTTTMKATKAMKKPAMKKPAARAGLSKAARC